MSEQNISWGGSSVIEEWKERNLRRVDIGGMSVMVLSEDAMRHLEAVNIRMARMKMALHRISKMHPNGPGAGNVAREGLSDG